MLGIKQSIKGKIYLLKGDFALNRCFLNKANTGRILKSLLAGAVTGTVNGLFGSGGGTIAVMSMVMLLKADEHKAHATAISVILPITIVSSLLYISKSHVDLGITWKASVGGIIGGYIGARLLHICPENILKKVFGVLIIAAAVRLLI
jgi:uncharacterized protein